MKKTAILLVLFAVCLSPVAVRADCASQTKACSDAQAAARRCKVQWGFRAKAMCEAYDKAAQTACAQANKECGGTGGETVTIPAQGGNQ